MAANEVAFQEGRPAGFREAGMNKFEFFNCDYCYDFGHEFFFTFLKIRRFALVEASLTWNDYAGGPYIQICMGEGRLLGVISWIGRLGVSINIATRAWER